MADGGPAAASAGGGYIGPEAARLWRRNASRLAFGAALFAWVAGGCSFSYQLGSMLDNPAESGKHGERTAGGAPEKAADAPAPNEADLAFAREAFADALAKGGTTRSTPWENPRTGARGTVTPIALATKQADGFVCRDFLASYLHAGAETWLEGEACRVHQGRWEVRRLTPWKRT